MNVLSKFDGMSCGQIALNRANIPVDKYFASEVDKYAIQVTQKNYPDTIQLGDIMMVSSDNLPVIDLLIGGSPCQGFSFAGKQLNFDDSRSKLFFEYVRVWKELKKKNSNLKFLLENVKMKKESQDIISKLLGVEPIEINSALVSAQNRKRLYWTNLPNVTQPEDKGLVLKDILENGVVDKDKSYCIDANYWKGGNLKSYFNKGRRQLVFDNPYILQRARGFNKGGIRAKNGKTPTLDSNSWEHNNFLLLKGRYRKLTPIECERLQTVPDNYTEGVSNTQRYKMLGNGWTVDVIAHILKGIK